MSRGRIGLVILALFFSSLCYLYGFFLPVSGKSYTGIRSINASDYNVNLSWIEQFREGHFLLKNLYTSEPHRAFLVRPVYFFVTVPFGLLPISNTAIFHILRIVCGAILLFVLFQLLEALIGDQTVTNIAFLLLVFTSGAGVVLKTWLPGCIDLSVPESVLFLTLGEAPHFQYSFLFLWSGVIAIYLAINQPNRLLLYFLCLVLLWWEHPFDAVILAAIGVVNAWQLRGRSKLLMIAGTIVVSIPPFLYYRSLEKLPAYAGWAAQNLMLSPAVPALISPFLPLLLLSIPAMVFLRRNPDKKKLLAFLLLWILTQFILAYTPLPFQRRLIAGVQLPFAVLAAFTLERLRARAVIAAILILLTATNIYVMTGQIRAIATKEMPFYLPRTYQQAFDWLAGQKTKGAVFSGFITGNFIPGYTGFSVYAGHSALTPQIQIKRQQMIEFFQSPKADFLKKNQIDYIFWGLEEQRTTSKNLEDFFPPVYTRNGIAILSAKTTEEPAAIALERRRVRKEIAR